MLSRVAEAIYWMARYIERAENLARFIDVTLNVMLDQPGDDPGQWLPLVRTTGDEEWFQEHYGEPTQENVIRFLTFERAYPNSIISVLSAARENARSIRETISSEMWEQLNEWYHVVRTAAKGDRPLESPSEFFHEVKRSSHLFNGLMNATMARDEGWHFANVGKLIERADKTSRILDVKYFILLPDVQDIGTPIDDLQWSAVLRSVSGFEIYRKRHHGITPHRIVEFLVLDRSFPRAIQYCVCHADESLHEITGTPHGTFRNLAEQRLGQLRGELSYIHVEQIVTGGLHEFIDRLQTKLNSVHDAIDQTFFALRPVAAAPELAQSQMQSVGIPWQTNGS
jgi:uncharacterized alpha-E superfamily protein